MEQEMEDVDYSLGIYSYIFGDEVPLVKEVRWPLQEVWERIGEASLGEAVVLTVLVSIAQMVAGLLLVAYVKHRIREFRKSKKKKRRLQNDGSCGDGPCIIASTQTCTKDMPLIGRGYLDRTILRGINRNLQEIKEEDKDKETLLLEKHDSIVLKEDRRAVVLKEIKDKLEEERKESINNIAEITNRVKKLETEYKLSLEKTNNVKDELNEFKNLQENAEAIQNDDNLDSYMERKRKIDLQMDTARRRADMESVSVPLGSDQDSSPSESSLSLNFNSDHEIPHHTFSMPFDHAHTSMARMACVQPRLSNTVPGLERDLQLELMSLEAANRESPDVSDNDDNLGHFTDV